MGLRDQPSLRDYGAFARLLPNLERLGYCHLSLRDESGAARSILHGIVLFAVVVSTVGVASLSGAEGVSHESQLEKAIQAFEAADKTNPAPQDAVLFIGSSSIRLWTNLAQSFPGHKVINRGFGGSHLSDSVAFVERIVIPYKPKLVLIYAGDNDIASGKTPEQVFEDFKRFVEKIHSRLPETG